ncbi:MAG: DNA (cytosine-5-)-methyltransferase [Duncaniella sp.]|nr:DNA (cytosine-5-)-methyltransferase [Duncaniella sp.]
MKTPKTYSEEESLTPNKLCEPLTVYSSKYKLASLFPYEEIKTDKKDIRVIELFAGVGGFRVGLERASERFKTIWSNQWEPSTKRQDASMIYCRRFGYDGHSNEDINLVDVSEIPDGDLLVGGFPCQDYSVATTLKNSGGIKGKKGVLWWQIHRILSTHANPPKYLMLENVDRLLGSPASQRGRDFAIILASLSDLGYNAEWRVINAAEYGMPQRRRRTYIFAYHKDTEIARLFVSAKEWLFHDGVMAKAFNVKGTESPISDFHLHGSLSEISSDFNIGKKQTPFKNSGLMIDRKIYTVTTQPDYSGESITLGDIILPESVVSEEFFIPESDIPRWKYAKGGKSEKRINKTTGYEYSYSEGAMAFPDSTDRPSRTIITGEGGSAPSRFKHVILTESGRYRRLTPIELERLNMFPDNHTEGASDMRRAFLMGNALVTGIVERIGIEMIRRICH